MQEKLSQTNTINTILNKLSRSQFTGSTIFTSLADVEEALSGQVEHRDNIIELRDKINKDLNSNSNKFTNSGKAKNIIGEYVNFINYIIALIEAKIAKDKAMTALLNDTFIGVNSFITILEGSKKELTSKNITEKILQNIGINDKDLKFKISNLGLKNAEKVGLNIDDNEMIEQNSIKGLVTKIIENCQTKLTKSIEGFTGQLDTIIEEKSKAGGDGNPNTSPNGSFKNLSNANLIVPEDSNLNEYQQSFMDIKNNYENGLKDNIRAYREICEILLSEEQNSPGILKIIIDSVSRLNVVNKEITKRFGFKLGLFQDKPFAANKTAFEKLKKEINDAKNELLNTSVKKQSKESVVAGPVEEKRIEGSQPLKESFERFLDNLQRESDNANLEPYRISLLDSLGNINDALVKSFKPPGVSPVQIDTGYSHNYIAYDFGWININSSRIEAGGEWRDNGITEENKSPTDTISDYITILEKDTITKQSLETILSVMIELLQFEESTAEKSATSPGVNTSDFRETQESFKPNLKFLNIPSGGGYKKKSKSKKMTSKKTSMKVAKKTSSKENKNKNKKIVKSYSKSKSKKQSGGFIRGGVLFPQDFYDTSTVM